MTRTLVEGKGWILRVGTCPACGSTNCSTGCTCIDCGWGNIRVVINGVEYDANDAPKEKGE